MVAMQIISLLSSFLPGTLPTINLAPSCCVEDRLELLIKTCLSIYSEETLGKITELLNPLANKYKQHFINCLALLSPTRELVAMVTECKSILVYDLFCSKIINENILNFINLFVHNKTFNFNAPPLINIAKESYNKNIGIDVILEIITKSFNKLEFNKQELKDIQDISLKIIDKQNNIQILNKQITNLIDTLWNEDKDKLIPNITHLLATLIPTLRNR